MDPSVTQPAPPKYDRARAEQNRKIEAHVN